MSESKPKLKLSFSFAQPPDTSSTGAATSQAGSPPPSSAIRTPSIKLNFGKSSTPVASSDRTFTPPAKKRKADTGASGPDSAKKRKPNAIKQEPGKTANGEPPKPQRKLTFTNKALEAQQPIERPAPPARAPTLKINAKGKIPKRELGNGWDSENEETEKDPVILDGFILRMQPGSDCDYLQKHITEGTMGQEPRHGGANVRFRLFDVYGRRGMMTIREHPYAIAMVDLPCVVEGMKTWDKKAAVKSLDISQMLLVLGPCTNKEEAEKYPLPPEVDPKTYNYAHGLTPPMHYVRKRRFDKTKRAKLEDIEEVERRVKALLAADKAAKKVSWKTYDHDPTDELAEQEDDDGEEYSATEDGEDAEGEDEDEDREPADYFHNQPGQHQLVDTPGYNDSPAMMDESDEDEGDIEAEFMAGLDNDDDEEGDTGTDQLENSAQASQRLQPRAGTEGASSFAVTSTSASPSANIDTPGGGEASTNPAGSPSNQTPQDQVSDDDDDNDPSNDVSDAQASDAEGENDDDDEDEDEDDKEHDREQDEARQEAKDNITEMENKVRQIRAEMGTKVKGSIVSRKLREKAEGLEGEVEGLRRKWGL